MKHADIFSQVIKQVKQSKFTPSAAFMNINGEVIDILDKKNREVVSNYLKINELPKHQTSKINSCPNCTGIGL